MGDAYEGWGVGGVLPWRSVDEERAVIPRRRNQERSSPVRNGEVQFAGHYMDIDGRSDAAHPCGTGADKRRRVREVQAEGTTEQLLHRARPREISFVKVEGRRRRDQYGAGALAGPV